MCNKALTMGLEPITLRLEVLRAIQLRHASRQNKETINICIFYAFIFYLPC